jgi:hypothetical protein
MSLYASNRMRKASNVAAALLGLSLLVSCKSDVVLIRTQDTTSYCREFKKEETVEYGTILMFREEFGDRPEDLFMVRIDSAYRDGTNWGIEAPVNPISQRIRDFHVKTAIHPIGPGFVYDAALVDGEERSYMLFVSDQTGSGVSVTYGPGECFSGDLRVL